MDDLITWSRNVLATTPVRWVTLIKFLPVKLLTRPPAQGEWSAVECFLHLLDAERWVFPPRVDHLLAGEDFPAFNPDTQGAKFSPELDLRALVTEFTELREKTLEKLAAVGTADLDRTARHGELGVVTLGEMLHEWAAHDLMHTVQAEQALMQPFIAGSGPWKPYFEKHWVEV